VTVIATAGHVDHGKSTLVRALTGTDPDRLAEEKARGLTIDLGFANLALPSGRELSFIDVPGHIRFLRNMLAGVGAVEGCLFVVAATEGWKPQSEEHLRILDLLGIRHGVVALTKVDHVDEDLLELAQLDVAEHVEGTFLDEAPVVPVAATEGIGLDELTVALDGLVDRMGAPVDKGRPRLWVDRAFAPSGAGTVITGTLTGGSLATNDIVTVLPGQADARVRGLQSHHRETDRVPGGNRVAVNLTGISHHDLGRGSVLVHPEQWHLSKMLDAELRVLPSLDHDVSRRGAYAAYFGSGEFPAKVRVLGSTSLAPGETGSVRIHLERPLPLLPGDRFILRESGRDETIGGGEVLDVEPMLPASRARPDRSIDRLVAERGWVRAEHLTRIVGHEVPPTVDGWVVAPYALTAMQSELADRIEQADSLGLELASLSEQERVAIEAMEGVEISTGRATMGIPTDPLADHPWVEMLESSPFSPPPPEGFDRGEVRELVRRGVVIEQDGVFFAAGAVEQAARLVAGRLAECDGLTVADVRDLLGTSRKYVLPMLNYFDRNGITRRRDDIRIAGPRLPEL
jgi:selenocysteine-specific elongation factor